MNKIPFVVFILICSIHAIHAQITKNVIYIVDSIPVTEHLEDGDADIDVNFIDEVITIKNKDSLKAIGYPNMGEAVLIFTKAYCDRSEDTKRIPTTKQMRRVADHWCLKDSDTPYDGDFIDYFYNGLKQGEGTFKNGKLTGLRRVYYPNGNIEHEGYYENGGANGAEKFYYEDGTLKEEGEYVNSKENGIWKSYYPNGKLQLLSKYKNGALVDSAFKYYSNGTIKERVSIKRNMVKYRGQLARLKKIYESGIAAEQLGDHANAIKEYTKCLQIDNHFADAYFARGTAKLNSLQFDDAITDFDKAIEIEPYYTEALANRAFCRIRKYQFMNSRTLSSNNNIAVLAQKEEMQVSADEQQKICNDLREAMFLGDHSSVVKKAAQEYCSAN